jgi:hypothetical protein
MKYIAQIIESNRMKTPLLLGSLLMASMTFGQQLYVEDFEGYAAGDYVTNDNPNWITWSGNGNGTDEDGLITNAEAHSGSNSLNVIGQTGPMDVVLVAGVSTGSYECNWHMKVPANYAAYYNVQENTTPGVGWAFENFFAEDGTFEVEMDGNVVASGAYPVGSWFELKHQVDLDNNFIQIYIDDVWAGAWTFDSDFGGVNFFGTGTASAVGNWWLDDIVIQTAEFTLNTAEIEPQLELSFGPNPATNTIFLTGNVEQGMIRILGLNGRLVHESRINGLNRGAQLDLNLVDGIYFIELTEGERRTMQRLVISH